MSRSGSSARASITTSRAGTRFPTTGGAPFAVWQGGLGVWGGILFGCLAGAFVIRRAGESVRLFADAVAPGLLIAQGIGRWGNWFNQELYGKPTNLPWGLEIDERHRPPQYIASDTFHPTFLYEFIYDLSMAGVLILIGWRFKIKPPGLFALYVAFYTFGRMFEEKLRVDPSHHFLGERLNFWVSLVMCVASVVFFVWWQFLRKGGAHADGAAQAPDPDRPAGTGDGRSEGPRPPAPLASGACWSASSSSTSTRSKVPSTCCSPSSCARSWSRGTSTSPTSSSRSSSGSAERERLDLDACGEFLVLVGALLELKARELFPEEQVDLADLDPQEAAEELARRLEEFRKIKEAAGWLLDRLAAENDRYFRLGPAPLAPTVEPKIAPQSPEALAGALRALATPPPDVSLAHMGLRFPPVVQFLERFRALLRRRKRFDFDQEAAELTRVEQAVALLALLELRKAGEIRDRAGRAVRADSDHVAQRKGISIIAEEGDSSWNARSA